MEDVRAGLAIRAVRLQRGLRQIDLAARAGLSRETISRLERGEADGATVRTLRLVSTALGMPPIVSVGWRGADIAELLDQRHAGLVERIVAVLGGLGWDVVVEYSFAHYGERGSVDVLAWSEATESLLVVEVKTRIVDLQDLFATLDRKRRLVPRLVAEERGWRAKQVGVVLVAPSTTAIRATVERHGASSTRRSLPARWPFADGSRSPAATSGVCGSFATLPMREWAIAHGRGGRPSDAVPSHVCSGFT